MGTFQAIMLGLAAAEKLSTMIQGMIARAKQKNELTPEQEAVVDAKQKALMEMDHWKVDPDPS